MKELKSWNKFLLWKEPHWEGYLVVFYFYLQYEFQFEKYSMNYSGIPTFLCSLIYCVISVWVSPVYAEYISTAIVTHRYFRFLRRKCIYAYCFLIVNRFVVFFLCSLIYCVISVWVSAVYAKYVSTPIQPSNVHKKSVLKETRIPVVHVNNLRLVWFLRFSVAWFIV